MKKSSSKRKAKQAAPKVNEKCVICEYSTFEKYRMKRHMRTHTGEKPFMCGVCDQSFSQKSSLKEHLWKHTALRSSHKCPHCNAIFNLPVDVKAHISNMHNVCDPVACTMCQVVFTDRYSLLQHQKSHDNMYRYQCLECIFSSRDKMKLILHMSIHKKRRPLMCSACKETFKHKHTLLNHLFRKHDITTFGDGYSTGPTTSSRETIEEEAAKKTTNQQQLEEQFQILDEDGNALHLSEADAEAIHAAMQQSSEDGTLQIMQGDEGTMTVTVLTVAHNLDGSIQNIEQNVELCAVGATQQTLEQGELSEDTTMMGTMEASGDNQVYETVQVANAQGDMDAMASAHGQVYETVQEVNAQVHADAMEALDADHVYATVQVTNAQDHADALEALDADHIYATVHVENAQGHLNPMEASVDHQIYETIQVANVQDDGNIYMSDECVVVPSTEMEDDGLPDGNS